MLTFNTFHNLPKWVQGLFKPRRPQLHLVINAFRRDGKWWFHKLPITFNEGLHAIELLDRLGGGATRLQIELTTEQQPADQRWMVLQFERLDDTEAGASWWHLSGSPFFLCSWLPFWFGFIPQTLYVRLTPSNDS